MAEVELQDAPQGVRTYYDKGVAALERSNFEYAMDMFAAALKIEPRLLSVRKLLRLAAIKNTGLKPPGKLTAAKSLGAFMKASAMLKKDPQQAIERAEDLLRIDPLNFKFAKLQCDAAEAAGHPEIAILTLEMLKENTPPNLAILNPLARLYRTAERFDDEYACHEAMVKLKPNDTNALKELKDSAARLTMGKAGWQKAESFRDVIRTETEAASASNELEQLTALLQAEPDNVNHILALADYQTKRRLFGDAVLTLKNGLNVSGGDPRLEQKLWNAQEQELLFQLAEAEDSQEENQISRLRKQLSEMRITTAARKVEQYPNDLQMKFEYGKLLFDADQLTAAVQQFQLAQRNPQRRVRSLIYLAKAFEKKGQLNIALEQLEAALNELQSMDETRKEVLYQLGLLQEKMGNKTQAESCLKEIYTVDIGYRDVAERIENSADC
ncbi:hypothetical protein P4B35_05730 [Pontiellaceae bacterium B12227]|nr:hypothetical protein [Pontiellaceae bacterium B12227]